MKEKKAIRICAVLIGVIGVFIIGISVMLFINGKSDKEFQTNTNRDLKKLSDNQKKIFGLLDEKDEQEKRINEKIEKEINKKIYSDEYQKYLELSEEEKNKVEVIPRKERIPASELEEIKQIEDNTINLNNDTNITDEIPNKFSLADTLQIDVENQGSFGLCWDFASLKTIETFEQLHNQKKYDLSEIQVDYILSNLMYGNREVHDGGNFSDIESYSLKYGFSEEQEGEYRDHSKEEYQDFINRPSVTNVADTINFPSLYKYETEGTQTIDVEEFRKTVKKHIMKNGGLYTVITDPAVMKDNNLYCKGDCGGRGPHAVTIIGWDDNYSKDNFTSGKGDKPEHDGAYIALNSWGKEWHDNGYFYISYDDYDVETQLSGVVSTTIDSLYKIDDIKSEKIKEILRQKIGYQFIEKDGEEYISKIALKKISKLDLSGNNLTSEDLNDLSIFPRLLSVDLSNNDITDISSLNNLKSLISLNLSNNKVQDVSPLKDLESLYELNLSNNEGVSGYGNLKVESLNLSGCNINNINEISNMSLYTLDLSNNHNMNLEGTLPDSIRILSLENCNLDRLTNVFNVLNMSNLHDINLSNNNFKAIDSLPNYIKFLDISNNKSLTDYSFLKNREFIGLTINNNNINDITKFNDVKASTLNLSNNSILDISKFKNANVNSIDLSGNNNIKGLGSLKNLSSVVLKNCNLNSIDELSTSDKIIDLDLSNNNITDMNEISNIKSLSSLSLANNKNIKGKLKNEQLAVLNISDNNLKTFDFTELPNGIHLNISGNNEFDLEKLLKDKAFSSIDVKGIKLSQDDYEKIIKNEDLITINNMSINYNLDNNNEYDLNSNEFLKKKLLKNILYFSIDNIENVKISKNVDKISLLDDSKNKAKFSTMGETIYNDKENKEGYKYKFLNNVSFEFSKK